MRKYAPDLAEKFRERLEALEQARDAKLIILRARKARKEILKK